MTPCRAECSSKLFTQGPLVLNPQGASVVRKESKVLIFTVRNRLCSLGTAVAGIKLVSPQTPHSGRPRERQEAREVREEAGC